jgi:2-polyprenyl-3-methyl-5-hydroxy-6-metoxy-1,4-benzoquinol methylase
LRDCRHADIVEFIADVRAAIIPKHPEQKDLFDIYANEASFGFSVIEDDIDSLQRDAAVLEVGAGIFLLSGYLASQGMRVHALEPTAAGFSRFRELQIAVTNHYEKSALQLHWIRSPIEYLTQAQCFDYTFSINVFEHVQDVESGLSNAYRSLKPGGALRIYCPNYHFPYEPHFNILTVINKRVTEFLFKSSIMESSRMPEPKETWDALNWINVTRVRRLFRNRFGNKPMFNRLATYQIFARVLTDSRFGERRSRWVTTAVKALDRVGLMHALRFFPVTLAPVMDFKVEREPDNPRR